MDVVRARHEYVRWLRATRDLSAHSIRAYDGDITAFERLVGSELPASDIDRNRLIEFLEAQRSAGLASTTVKRRASGLRGFCKWLLDRGTLSVDPWAGLSVSTGRGRTLPPLPPSGAIELLLATIREHAGLVGSHAEISTVGRPNESTTLLAVALMVGTGIRVNELVSIRCEDVDLPRGTVRIVGKGRRERLVFLTNRWIEELIAAYLQMRSHLGVAHDRLLFNARLAPLTAPAMRARLAKAAAEAGLGIHLTPHMLRHGAATRLIEEGVDIRLIQTLLGHASLTTTEIYTHISNVALQRVLADADVLGLALALR